MSKFQSIFANSRTRALTVPGDMSDGDQINVTIRKISHAGKKRINSAERSRANEALKEQIDEVGRDGLELIEDLRLKSDKSRSDDGEPEDATLTARPSRAEREAAAVVAEADAKASTKTADAEEVEEIDVDSIQQLLGSMNLNVLLIEGVKGWNVLTEDNEPMPFDEAAIDLLADDMVMWLADQVLRYNKRSFRLSGEGQKSSASR